MKEREKRSRSSNDIIHGKKLKLSIGGGGDYVVFERELQSLDEERTK